MGSSGQVASVGAIVGSPGRGGQHGCSWGSLGQAASVGAAGGGPRGAVSKPSAPGVLSTAHMGAAEGQASRMGSEGKQASCIGLSVASGDGQVLELPLNSALHPRLTRKFPARCDGGHLGLRTSLSPWVYGLSQGSTALAKGVPTCICEHQDTCGRALLPPVAGGTK